MCMLGENSGAAPGLLKCHWGRVAILLWVAQCGPWGSIDVTERRVWNVITVGMLCNRYVQPTIITT